MLRLKWKRDGRRVQKANLTWVQLSLRFSFKGGKHHASVNNHSLLLMKNYY
jgi:hypothetical protein